MATGAGDSTRMVRVPSPLSVIVWSLPTRPQFRVVSESPVSGLVTVVTESQNSL